MHVQNPDIGMKRKFRLRKSSDFKRVRRLGKSYAHPFIVLIKNPNQADITRIGISAGRSVGNAVNRNRTKRRLREIVRPRVPKIEEGWDIVVIARKPIQNASQIELQDAFEELIDKAQLTKDQHVH
jgi:ribonuclease P protein component